MRGRVIGSAACIERKQIGEYLIDQVTSADLSSTKKKGYISESQETILKIPSSIAFFTKGTVCSADV